MVESMVMQNELRVIGEQIKKLRRRQRELKKQLRATGDPPLPSSYFAKPIKLYVLKLEDNCYYVGMSRNVEGRLKRHKKGKGAMWTTRHRPIEIFKLVDTGLTNDSEAAQMENELTIEMARLFGPDKVRGGGYCQQKPRWPDELYH